MLSAAGVTFGYQRERPILEDWSVELEAGALTAITGPSGRGKSTLLYLLGLMLRPSSGEVFLDGVPVSALRDRERAHLRAKRFGFVFQDASLDLSRTVLDNVLESALYRPPSAEDVQARARELLEEFGVELRASARPGQVSGGQAQRIALCRALLGRPRVLLADEPTGNLDPASANVVLDAFRAHADTGATVIVVTHDPSVVATCDRTVEL